MAQLNPQPVFKWFKDDGTIASGWKVHTYEPGTTTNKDTYTNSSQGSTNANPVILNSRGEADIWFNGVYKLVIKDDSDITQDTIDNYGTTDSSSSSTADNLAPNGGFETDSNGDGIPDGWTQTVSSGSTASIDTSDQIEAAQSWKLVSTGTAGSNLISTSFIEIDQNQTYTLQFELKSSIAGVKNQVDVLWYTAAQATVSTTNVYTNAVSNPTSWTQKTGDLTPPSTARYAKIQLYACNDTTAGTTAYDGIVFFEKRGDTTYLGLGDTPSAFVANLVPEVNSGGTAIEFIDRKVPGFLNRANFTWASTTTFTINAGVYHLAGTSDQNVMWNSALTFTPGSGGSNAASTDLGNNETHYVYIDDSAVVTLGVATVLTNSEFINNTTAPTFNQTKKGWYNGTDRCVFSFTTNGSAQIDEFFHDGGETLYFADQVSDLAATDIDTTWTDVTLSIPGFSTSALCSFDHGASATGAFYWRTNGQTATTGHQLTASGGLGGTTVITDSNQIIELKENVSDTATISCNTNGWLFPGGM